MSKIILTILKNAINQESALIDPVSVTPKQVLNYDIIKTLNHYFPKHHVDLTTLDLDMIKSQLQKCYQLVNDSFVDLPQIKRTVFIYSDEAIYHFIYSKI